MPCFVVALPFLILRLTAVLLDPRDGTTQLFGATWRYVDANVRCGINTGMANVGNYGSEGFMEVSAVGLNVNLAARLEQICEPVASSYPTRRGASRRTRCSASSSERPR
jgi:class 3 adenylate cyclase